MLRGLTTASSGMLVDQRMEQALATNLANMQTPGYKSVSGESLSFPQQLIEALNGQGTIGELGTGADYQEGVPYFGEGTLTNTGRSLDVAIQDSITPGTYASVVGTNNQLQSVEGQVAVGANSRLEIAGQPVAVINGQNQPVKGVYAVLNPNYKPSQPTAGLIASDGKPNYDAAGNPSYLFANANGKIIGSSADVAYQDLGLRIGNQNDMGVHQFFPVRFTAFNGTSGIVLTKDGHFSVNAQNQLVDASGHPILPINGTTGQPIVGATIEINPKYTGKALFNADGTAVKDAHGNPSFQVVDANGNVIPNGKLGTVGADVTTLSSLGQTEYMVNGNTQIGANFPGLYLNSAGASKLVPGDLEQSNVNQNQTMTQMIQVLNEYQANQNILQTEAQALDVATTDIGKVNI